jgi:hypothetical protein
VLTRQFWLDALERAGKTFFQDLLAPLAIGGVASALHQPWLTILETSAVAALISLASSIGSLPVNGNGSASLIRDVHTGRHEANPPTPEVTN